MDTPAPPTILHIDGVSKRFHLHAMAGSATETIRALDTVDATLAAGECVGLAGPSGSGKSSLMRMVYGTYRVTSGRILLRHSGGTVDLANAPPRTLLALRRGTIGYVSQFLRAIPRVAALEVVAEPLLRLGVSEEAARDRAAALMARLGLPRRLWGLSPLTFSGGEQQRVNVARGLIHRYPLVLLDEPTASLDPDNAAVVLDLIREATGQGSAILGIFHDPVARAAVCDRLIDLTPRREAAFA